MQVTCRHLFLGLTLLYVPLRLLFRVCGTHLPPYSFLQGKRVQDIIRETGYILKQYE